VHARLHLFLAEHFDRVPMAFRRSACSAIPLNCQGRRRPGVLRCARNCTRCVASDSRFDLIEVLSAEALDQFDFVGKASNTVEVTVGE